MAILRGLQGTVYQPLKFAKTLNPTQLGQFERDTSFIVKSVNPQINCLVLSGEKASHKLISRWLGVSKRVSSVTAARDEKGLKKYLSNATCHLCILIIDSADQLLPTCTLNYPNMRVLAITTERHSGAAELLFQQGAHDVVSLNDPAAAQHTISRMIDECTLQVKMDELEQRNERLTTQLKSLQQKIDGRTHSFSICASNDNLHDISENHMTEFQVEAAPCIENIILSNLRDSATELPSRHSVMERFTDMLHSDVKAPRFTAMLVRILADKEPKEKLGKKSGTQQNVQDLTFHRAADALQNCVKQTTIFGRINQNALLLIQPSDIEPVSRDAANRVRESLGNLGGLIDAKQDVRINTMNLPSSTTISADEVVERLELLAN